MSAPVGILVNPRSGGDLRRAVAAAGRSTVEDKISIVRRLVLGARAAGAERILVNHDPHQIVRRATETIRDVELATVAQALTFTEQDSTVAASAMRDAGCVALAVLGGDGTNRAVCKGWRDVPVIPVSTGTNNAFPDFIEPTVAGSALGLIATAAVELDEVTTRAKLIHVEISGGNEPSLTTTPDVALIDTVAVDDPYVGSLELFDPATLRLAVLTRADPAAIGFSAVGGLVDPLTAHDDGALLVRFTPTDDGDMIVEAPTAPGHHDRIGVGEVRRLQLGERVSVEGPVLLAFDGERKRRVHEQQRATFSVHRDGPRVIDPRTVMASGRRRFVDPRPSI